MNAPPGYVAACARLERIVRATVKLGLEVRFVLPPREIMLVGGLDQIGYRLARSPAAHSIVTSACAVPPSEMPTVAMLAAVLEHCGVEVRRVSLGDLGLTAGGGVSS